MIAREEGKGEGGKHRNMPPRGTRKNFTSNGLDVYEVERVHREGDRGWNLKSEGTEYFPFVCLVLRYCSVSSR